MIERQYQTFGAGRLKAGDILRQAVRAVKQLAGGEEIQAQRG
jgi:hypothetical protein